MEIRLKETEIKAAIELWITNEGFSLDNKSVSIDFTAGRSPNGLTAEVEVISHSTAVDANEVAEDYDTMIFPVKMATEAVVEDSTPDPSAEDTETESPFLDTPNDVKVTGDSPALDLDLD